jgi:predicted DNA-binding protein
MDWKPLMSKVNTLTAVENIVQKMHELSEDEQRTLAAVIVEDRKLEAFVEELEDQLSCERATEEGSTELFLS